MWPKREGGTLGDEFGEKLVMGVMLSFMAGIPCGIAIALHMGVFSFVFVIVPVVVLWWLARAWNHLVDLMQGMLNGKDAGGP